MFLLHVFWEIKKGEYLEAWSSVAVACWHVACRLAQILWSLASLAATSQIACLLPVLLCHDWRKLSILLLVSVNLWLAGYMCLPAVMCACSLWMWVCCQWKKERLCLWQALCRMWYTWMSWFFFWTDWIEGFSEPSIFFRGCLLPGSIGDLVASLERLRSSSFIPWSILCPKTLFL